MTFEYGPDRAAFWNDYVQRAGWGVDSAAAYDDFLSRQQYIGGLFDLWSDPNQVDWVQSAAYTAFWQALAEYGLDRDSFDWIRFREKYKLYAGT